MISSEKAVVNQMAASEVDFKGIQKVFQVFICCHYKVSNICYYKIYQNIFKSNTPVWMVRKKSVFQIKVGESISLCDY